MNDVLILLGVSGRFRQVVEEFGRKQCSVVAPVTSENLAFYIKIFVIDALSEFNKYPSDVIYGQDLSVLSIN